MPVGGRAGLPAWRLHLDPSQRARVDVEQRRQERRWRRGRCCVGRRGSPRMPASAGRAGHRGCSKRLPSGMVTPMAGVPIGSSMLCRRVLTGAVTDDTQPVRGRVEVDAERRINQRHAQLRNLRSPHVPRLADRVDTAGSRRRTACRPGPGSRCRDERPIVVQAATTFPRLRVCRGASELNDTRRPRSVSPMTSRPLGLGMTTCAAAGLLLRTPSALPGWTALPPPPPPRRRVQLLVEPT